MTEYFRITGLNLIPFDSLVTLAADQRYRLRQSPKGIDKPLTKEEAIPHLRNLPTEIASHIIGRPGEHVMSIITFPFSIQGGSDPDMEDAEHDLRETLEDGKLYIKTRGARGTRAVLEMQSNLASQRSYKTMFWGEFVEDGGRAILGDSIKEHYIQDLQMRLYCEPYWRPSSTTNLVNAQTVYNHDDGHAGHDNFVDIVAANIAGDVPARVRLLIDGSDTDNLKFVMVARRSQGTPANFDHWWEAEDADIQTTWADELDITRSNGSIVQDDGVDAHTTGSLTWNHTANLDHWKGQFAVYASIYTDDIVNTQIRGSYHLGGAGDWCIGQWKKNTKVNAWQLMHLFNVVIGGEIYPPGQTLAELAILVQYQKDAADTVKCDYILFLPVDESVMQLEGEESIDGGATNSDYLLDNTADFLFIGMLDNGSDYSSWVALKGNALTLQPNVNNRIYFKWLCVIVPAEPYDDHEDLIEEDQTPETRTTVTLDYLPQFISPLE